MARKICPACKKLNGGSAAACECGHAFPASSIVAAQRTTKRCPSCRSEQPLLLETCGCGQQFMEIVELRAELVGELHSAWARIVIGFVVLAACAGIAIATSGTWLVGLIGGVMLGVRGLMRRADARAALRNIDAAAGTLPRATARRA